MLHILNILLIETGFVLLQPTFFKSKMDSWVTHNTHVFILTAAGKPVWSRWHADNYTSASLLLSTDDHNKDNYNVSSLSSSTDTNPSSTAEITRLTSIIQAILARANEFHDPLTSLSTNNALFIFSTYGPLHLVIVSKTGNTEHSLTQLLRYLHSYILFSLTNKLHTRLHDRPNTDIRPLLQGTDIPLRTLIYIFNRSPSIWLDAFPIVSLSLSSRTKLFNILTTINEPVPTTNMNSTTLNAASGNIIYVMLTIGYSIVGWLQLKSNFEYGLRPLDTMLLLTFLNCNNTLRNADVWTPICLPGLSEAAYVHAYIAWLGCGNITIPSHENTNTNKVSSGNSITPVILITGNDSSSATTVTERINNTVDETTNLNTSSSTIPQLDTVGSPDRLSIVDNYKTTTNTTSNNNWFSLPVGSTNPLSNTNNATTTAHQQRPRISVTSPLALSSPTPSLRSTIHNVQTSTVSKDRRNSIQSTPIISSIEMEEVSLTPMIQPTTVTDTTETSTLSQPLPRRSSVTEESVSAVLNTLTVPTANVSTTNTNETSNPINLSEANNAIDITNEENEDIASFEGDSVIEETNEASSVSSVDTETDEQINNENTNDIQFHGTNTPLKNSKPLLLSEDNTSNFQSQNNTSSINNPNLLSPWLPPPPNYHPDKDNSPPIFLTFITTGTTSNHLDYLTFKRNQIMKLLGESGILLTLIRSYSSSFSSSTSLPKVNPINKSTNPPAMNEVSTIPVSMPSTNNGGIPFLTSDINPINNTYNIKGLIHFLYIWKPLRQYTMSLWPNFLNGYTRIHHIKRKNILRAYSRIYSRLTMPIPNLRHVMYSYQGGGFDQQYNWNNNNQYDDNNTGLLFHTSENMSKTDGNIAAGTNDPKVNPSDHDPMITTIAGINTTQAICISIFDTSINTEDVPPAMESLVKNIKRDHDKLFIMSGFNAL